MLVKNWMSRPVVTIDEDDSMQQAIQTLKEYRFRILLVIKNGKLTGIITDRDLKKKSASDATSLEIHELFYLISRLKVKDIMTPDPITVPFDYTVEETAEILLKNKISGVPVTDHENNIVGIITQTDIFRVLISLTGIGKRGIQFGLILDDRPGSIKKVSDIIRGHGGFLASILTSYDQVKEGYRNVYIRMFGIDRDAVEHIKRELRQKAQLIYMVDHRENMREIYQ